MTGNFIYLVHKISGLTIIGNVHESGPNTNTLQHKWKRVNKYMFRSGCHAPLPPGHLQLNFSHSRARPKTICYPIRRSSVTAD
jgi:hypothetical protein